MCLIYSLGIDSNIEAKITIIEQNYVESESDSTSWVVLGKIFNSNIGDKYWSQIIMKNI